MEKYNALAQITAEHLDGDLCRLVIEYENKYDLHIQLQYKDRFEMWYDYEIILHKKKKSVDFIKHDCVSCINCTHLERVNHFEKALTDYLYIN